MVVAWWRRHLFGPSVLLLGGILPGLIRAVIEPRPFSTDLATFLTGWMLTLIIVGPTGIIHFIIMRVTRIRLDVRFFVTKTIVTSCLAYIVVISVAMLIRGTGRPSLQALVSDPEFWYVGAGILGYASVWATATRGQLQIEKKSATKIAER